jgi:hypothetical protein
MTIKGYQEGFVGDCRYVSRDRNYSGVKCAIIARKMHPSEGRAHVSLAEDHALAEDVTGTSGLTPTL